VCPPSNFILRPPLDAIELHDAAADDDFVHHVVPVEAGWGATRQS
jgi:hypothetical protein